ncbi:hypothetical protein H0H92_005298, partial [Tricholoma furcatifolium]
MYPDHSFIFNSYADPPTVTLPRIKALTTGSLPTFVEAGNNFGTSSIEEDSLLKQLRLAGKKIGFLGDDTWMSAFPDTFDPNMTYPFEPFNLEDLHTVDEGVIKHLFPVLEDPKANFDFLVAHFLGVDHVGHRMGPDSVQMKAKLEQINDVLKRIVDLMTDDTLLVLLGDHGMDQSGSHGGDSSLETSCSLWIYSKGPALRSFDNKPPSSELLPYTMFPGLPVPHRFVDQIDILPTISLLLGLPIPYNNLGTVIPELFWRGDNGNELLRALKINAAQTYAYVRSYRSSLWGGKLHDFWDRVEGSWAAINVSAASLGDEDFVKYSNFNRLILTQCRSIWARFDPLMTGAGLLLLGFALIATWVVYSGLSAAGDNYEIWLVNVFLPR